MKNYIHRTIENELLTAAKEFPVVVLTGPRQTGKSTLLQHLFPEYYYVTFDDPVVRMLASSDPKFFLGQADKMIIDEIQYVPEILPYIKMAVDESREVNGHFIATGSQVFTLMSGVSESLAGRVALYNLLGFSHEEIPNFAYLDRSKCFARIFNGFFPAVITQNINPRRFYSAYVQTYLERDIRQIISVQDLKVFQSFLELLASRAASILNLSEIAKECGVSFTTAKRWLSLLEASHIVYLLRPYFKNISKRVVKAPKLYFTDTGLLSYLLRYSDSETLLAGPQNGAMFENMVVAELLKYKFNYNCNFELYFYRDANHNEIDVIVDYGQRVKLLEIKLTKTPNIQHAKGLSKGSEIIANASCYLLSFGSKKINFSSKIISLPWAEIFEQLT